MLSIQEKLYRLGWWKAGHGVLQVNHAASQCPQNFDRGKPAVKWLGPFRHILRPCQPQRPKPPLRAQHLATDWVWRPTFWQTPVAYSALSGAGNGTALNDEIKMFHNADHAQITSRQIIQIDPINLPDFGLSLDVYDFSSGYISLAVRLPAPFAKNLRKHHLLRMDYALKVRKSLSIFARLNIENGPNTTEISVQFPDNCENGILKFDLSSLKFTERRIKNIWVDLIFEAPAMNKITLEDIIFSRHPRAKL